MAPGCATSISSPWAPQNPLPGCANPDAPRAPPCAEATRGRCISPMHDPKQLEPGLEDYADAINQLGGGWNSAMDLHFERVTAEEVIATWSVGPQHLQPYGIVHGGVYCGVIEAVCSTGAAVSALPSGYSVVGLENSTSFVRAVRGGALTARARPIHP